MEISIPQYIRKPRNDDKRYKLSEEDLKKIFRMRLLGMSYRDIGSQFSVSKTLIMNHCMAHFDPEKYALKKKRQSEFEKDKYWSNPIYRENKIQKSIKSIVGNNERKNRLRDYDLACRRKADRERAKCPIRKEEMLEASRKYRSKK